MDAGIPMKGTGSKGPMTASRLQEEVIEPSWKGLKREIPDRPRTRGTSALALQQMHERRRQGDLS